jgi:proteasome assembly chaperone 3
VLGGTKREEEVLGQTLATMLGSAVLMKRPAEERMLVLGVGLQGLRGGSEVFEEMVGLCLRVL